MGNQRHFTQQLFVEIMWNHHSYQWAHSSINSTSTIAFNMGMTLMFFILPLLPLVSLCTLGNNLLMISLHKAILECLQFCVRACLLPSRNLVVNNEYFECRISMPFIWLKDEWGTYKMFVRVCVCVYVCQNLCSLCVRSLYFANFDKRMREISH